MYETERELIASGEAIVREVTSRMQTDEALERELKPDEPQRSSDDWLDELVSLIAWVTTDAGLLSDATPETDDDKLRRMLRVVTADLPDPDLADLRARLRWRAQTGLIEIAAQAVRAAVVIAEEGALDGAASAEPPS